MRNILKFSVSNVDIIDNVNKSLFRKLKVKAFATGENAHTLPITEDVLKRGAKTIYDKPIVWKYNKWTDDAEGHETDEVPVGFIKETDENPIIFETSEDGRIFLTIEALIWTRYCGRLIEIFERDGNLKDVSIEISTIDREDDFCDKPFVEDFCIAGITILGEMISPAVKGCSATLLNFSEDKEKYLNDLKGFSENAIKIENTKEKSVSGKWENPRRKLFNPIIKASNSKSLLKEAYLIGDFTTDEPEISKFKYPHHVIKDNELVLHKDGVQAAFQRAAQQDIVRGDIKKHLLRHYKELGLSTDNFEEFGMSKEEFENYFKDSICNNESGCIKNMADELFEGKDLEENTEKTAEGVAEDFSGEGADEAEKIAEDNHATEAIEMEDDDKADDEEKENTPDEKSDEAEDNDKDDNKEEFADEGDTEEKEMSVEEFKCEIEKMSQRISELEESNGIYMSKLETMSDYEDLKKFKCETEEKMAREKEMAEMEKVMSEISDKGFSISKENKDELIAKFKEFSSIEAWSNYVKATAFDMSVKTDDGIVKIGFPIAEPKKTGSIWDII